MARFRVTEELDAGVYRAGVGLFRPGDEFELPDAATPGFEEDEPIVEAPHWTLEPLDQDADDALQEIFGGTEKQLRLQPNGTSVEVEVAKPHAHQLKRFGQKSKAEKRTAKANKSLGVGGSERVDDQTEKVRGKLGKEMQDAEADPLSGKTKLSKVDGPLGHHTK